MYKIQESFQNTSVYVHGTIISASQVNRLKSKPSNYVVNTLIILDKIVSLLLISIGDLYILVRGQSGVRFGL